MVFICSSIVRLGVTSLRSSWSVVVLTLLPDWRLKMTRFKHVFLEGQGGVWKLENLRCMNFCKLSMFHPPYIVFHACVRCSIYSSSDLLVGRAPHLEHRFLLGIGPKLTNLQFFLMIDCWLGRHWRHWRSPLESMRNNWSSWVNLPWSCRSVSQKRDEAEAWEKYGGHSAKNTTFVKCWYDYWQELTINDLLDLI